MRIALKRSGFMAKWPERSVNPAVFRRVQAGVTSKDPGKMARTEKADLQSNISDRNVLRNQKLLRPLNPLLVDSK
jgi:hypothetical protein